MASDTSGPALPRIAFVLEGGRSNADHDALLGLADATERAGAEVLRLPHGLGRLAGLHLRRGLRLGRPDLVVATGAASLRDARPVARLFGAPLVCCYWPAGTVRDFHRGHGPGVAHVVPAHALVGSPAQAAEVRAHFGDAGALGALGSTHGAAEAPGRPAGAARRGFRRLARLARRRPLHEGEKLDRERVHVLPPPGPDAFAEAAALLIELTGERRPRSATTALLRDAVLKVARATQRAPRSLFLCYHQVVREVRGSDLNLVVAESTLERHLRALLGRGYHPLTVAAQAEQVLPARGAPGTQALAPVSLGRTGRASRPTFSISFDDGYLDTLEVAAPLLRAAGVPFTVYVVTDVVAGRRPAPWYEIAAHALLTPASAPRALAVLREDPLVAEWLSARGPSLTAALPRLSREVVERLKRMEDPRRAALCDALWREVGDTLRAHGRMPRYLDAAGVRALHALGAEISSHTCSHPILTSLDDRALATELADSRAYLCELVGDCPGLAYPNGDSDERIARAAEQAGYRYAVAVTPQPPRRFRLGRHMLSELSALDTSGRYDEDVLWGLLGTPAE